MRTLIRCAWLVAGLLGPPAAAAAPIQLLHHHAPEGYEPRGTLVADAAGNLYGTTNGGGAYNGGTVFRWNADGSGLTTLHAFGSSVADGANPDAGLVMDADGVLYGTTVYGGGEYNPGTVFRLNRDGSGFTILHGFSGWPTTLGAEPRTRLLLDGAGNLFGTTVKGGAGMGGTLFTLRTDGSGFALLHSFSTYAPEGAYPMWLTFGADGLLYGTSSTAVFCMAKDGSRFRVVRSFAATEEGPVGIVADRSGVLFGTTYQSLFRLGSDGTGYAVLHVFAGGVADGRTPNPELVIDGGAIFGTTKTGGGADWGTVFRIATDGSAFTILHAFAGTDGAWPEGGLLLDASGTLRGTTGRGPESGGLFAIGRDGQGFTLHYALLGPYSDGQTPRGGLLSDGAGHLFGTTSRGAGLAAFAGLVFRMDEAGGGFAVLHRFPWGGSEGGWPMGTLVRDGSGFLYGTAITGDTVLAKGVVYRLREDGSEFSVLHPFTGGASDGAAPAAGLLLEGGTLYGSTTRGGPSDLGTLFRVKTDGSDYRVLHAFAGGAVDGAIPSSALVSNGTGALLGTTSAGGAEQAGTVFRIDADGANFAILHSMRRQSDGGTPLAKLVRDAGGPDGAVLYGTASDAGPSGAGTVFRVNEATGALTVLHAFAGGARDGAAPHAAVILDANGYLEGTTGGGGPADAGTVFALRTDGQGFRLRHAFAGGALDGAEPAGDLAIDPVSGRLFGATARGGREGAGVEFALPALFPPAHHFTLTPCRAIDTRGAPGALAGPPLAAGTRTFVVAGACGVPADARTLAANVTVAGATADGVLRIFPADEGEGLASPIAVRVGRTRATQLLLTLSDGGAISVLTDLPPGASANLLVDVAGFFRETK